jgi:alginate O-acetyltransferase complex protein AlgI
MPATVPVALEHNPPAAGWLLYDAECRFCTASARRFARLIATRGFAILPLQTDWVREKLGLHATEPLREMIVLTRDDRRFGGADAALHLAGRFWWGRPLTWLAVLPGVKPLLRRAYAEIAARRSCAGGACALPAKRAMPRATDWLPLVALPAVAIAITHDLEPWIFMWALAGTIFAGCKWLTWRRGPHAHVGRSLGYLLAWPGMDAAEFLRDDPPVDQPRPREWWFALTKFAGGVALLWGGVHGVPEGHPLLTGWTGMFGLIFVLHFGLFHLLSLAWRRAGVNAEPLMRAPLLARSLAEFWGRRWNAAFNELAHRFVFRAVARRAGTTMATLTVFAVSGVLHDVVISLPARGGYGLPTVYFLLQAAGVLLERAPFARRLGLGRGWLGWIFTLIVTAAPLGLLFHPPFVQGVILPMLRAIGA